MLTRKMLATLALEIHSVEWNRPGVWWNYRAVNSPFSRLYLVTEGEAYVEHHGRRYHLKPLTLHLIPCFCTADYYCPRSFCHYHVTFTSRMAGGQDLFALQDCNYQLPVGSRERDLFRRLVRLNPGLKMADYDPYKSTRTIFRPQDEDLEDGAAAARLLESTAILLELLAPFLRGARPPTEPAAATYKRFQPVFAYIEENLARAVTLGELADIAGLNPNYFSSVFSELMGSGPSQYITQRRLERAQMMLLTTDRSIKEIAHAAGFASGAYFTRVFGRSFGQSPQNYRRGHPPL